MRFVIQILSRGDFQIVLDMGTSQDIFELVRKRFHKWELNASINVEIYAISSYKIEKKRKPEITVKEKKTKQIKTQCIYHVNIRDLTLT